MRRLSDDDRRKLPSSVDADVLEELLAALPDEASKPLINLLIDPVRTLAPHADGFAGKLGSDDPMLAEIIRRLYLGPDQSPGPWR